MRQPYICPYCDQRSTRRWNLEVHIRRRHGGYLLGRSSDRYMASDPFWYRKSVQSRHATVADSIGDTFQPRYVHQQAHLGTSQYCPRPIHPPQFSSVHAQTYGTGLSPDAIQKIQELKALMNKYPRYHTNPDSIIRLAVYNSINHDNTLLDDKLEQLRTIDSLAKY
jgi:hypothetical protein